MTASGASLLTGKHQSTHARLIREYVESLKRGLEAPVTAQEGRESIRVMSLIAEQLQRQGT